MRVTMLLFSLSSLLCYSVVLADRDEQLSLTDAVKMIRDLQEANVEVQRENTVMKSKISELQEANVEVKSENAAIQREISEVRLENGNVQRKNAEVQREISEVRRENADVQREISEVRRENAEVKREISEVRRENAEVEREISDVCRENAEVQREISEVRRENAEVKREISEVRRENPEVQRENDAMKSKISELVKVVSHVEMDLVDLQTNVSTSSQQISVLNDRESGHIGFSVAANQIEEYNAGDTIKFHHVFSDFKPSGTSGGWDPSSNTYTCPVTGHYMFIGTLYKEGAVPFERFVANLFHTSGSSDKPIVPVYNRGDPTTGFSSSAHAIVHCAAGDQVWFRNYYDDSTLYDSNSHINNFLGFLIRPGL